LRHSDFQAVYQRGKRHFARHMTVFYLPRSEGEGARIGFTVGRALGSAVVRNRLRRRLREAVRLHGMVDALVDVVINPKKSLAQAEFADLRGEIAGAFRTVVQNCRKTDLEA
jgi:ribonuclease P protein component